MTQTLMYTSTALYVVALINYLLTPLQFLCDLSKNLCAGPLTNYQLVFSTHRDTQVGMHLCRPISAYAPFVGSCPDIVLWDSADTQFRTAFSPYRRLAL